MECLTTSSYKKTSLVGEVMATNLIGRIYISTLNLIPLTLPGQTIVQFPICSLEVSHKL